MLSTVRLDKWLQVARVFKTRSQATRACNLNRVRVNGMPAKAHRNLALEDRVEIELGDWTRILVVKELHDTNRFPLNSEPMAVEPVTLPPGLARLATKPNLPKLLAAPTTIGIVRVAAAADRVGVPPLTMIRSTLAATSSLASAGNSLRFPIPQRETKTKFRPSK